MSNNSQKTPLARSLNKFAEKKVADAFQRTGQALPCSVVSVDGAIVTVKFEINSSFTLPNVTIPMVGAEYIRYPIQPGDTGCVFPADARLAGVSGIGGGVADLSQPANLTALVFLPISNAEWFEVDTQAVVIYGPNGVVLQDTGNASSITLTPAGIAIEAPELTITTTGDVTIHCANSNVTATAAANITAPTIGLHGTVNVAGTLHATGSITTDSSVTAQGEVTGNGIPLSTHKTTGVKAGFEISGGPIA